MKAVIKQVQGMSLVGKADSGHWVSMDAPENLGGEDAGARPLELFLLGLGGCTSMDVISILQKKRVHLEFFECFLDLCPKQWQLSQSTNAPDPKYTSVIEKDHSFQQVPVSEYPGWQIRERQPSHTGFQPMQCH